ncbi:hypothetical protein [Rhizobium sp.]|uniref:hypothetical protein n=1 Tax=Rhizobium sp. TaxID=391 RepID=UPI0028966C35
MTFAILPATVSDPLLQHDWLAELVIVEALPAVMDEEQIVEMGQFDNLCHLLECGLNGRFTKRSVIMPALSFHPRATLPWQRAAVGARCIRRTACRKTPISP